MICKADPSKCPCTYLSCSRRGSCCACVEFHRASGEVPGCLFSPEGERSYDRSKANFVRDCRKSLG